MGHSTDSGLLFTKILLQKLIAYTLTGISRLLYYHDASLFAHLVRSFGPNMVVDISGFIGLLCHNSL